MRQDVLRRGLTEYETLAIVAEGVAGDTLSLTIPMAAMTSLPEGAAFTKTEGRTRLNLKRKGNAVVAEAETDSICREVSRYERKARDSLWERGKTALHSSTTKEKPPNSSWAIWMLVGMAGTIGAIIVTRKVFM